MHVYAEYLHNIKTVSLQVTLTSLSNDTTAVELTADGRTVHAKHNGDSQIITLPVEVTTPSIAALSLPVTPSNILRFRLPVSKEVLQPSIQNIIPWTACDLSASTEISCASCKAVLVTRGKISRWKDLPSEGWAEMMEFWHCHKPHEPHRHDEEYSSKGYSSASQLVIESGVGLVDATTMLLSPNDTQHLDISPSQGIGIACASCKAALGNVEAAQNAYRLSKSSMATSENVDRPSPAVDRNKWLACSLLTAMDNQGVRRFNIVCSVTGDQAVSAWIFAPHLLVSSSSSHGASPQVVMKLMWKFSSAKEVLRNDEALNSKGAATGMLELRPNDFTQLLSCLQSRASLLPDDTTSFQGWNVTLLPRFTEDEI